MIPTFPKPTFEFKKIKSKLASFYCLWPRFQNIGLDFAGRRMGGLPSRGVMSMLALFHVGPMRRESRPPSAGKRDDLRSVCGTKGVEPQHFLKHFLKTELNFLNMHISGVQIRIRKGENTKAVLADLQILFHK